MSFKYLPVAWALIYGEKDGIQCNRHGTPKYCVFNRSSIVFSGKNRNIIYQILKFIQYKYLLHILSCTWAFFLLISRDFAKFYWLCGPAQFLVDFAKSRNFRRPELKIYMYMYNHKIIARSPLSPPPPTPPTPPPHPLLPAFVSISCIKYCMVQAHDCIWLYLNLVYWQCIYMKQCSYHKRSGCNTWKEIDWDTLTKEDCCSPFCESGKEQKEKIQNFQTKSFSYTSAALTLKHFKIVLRFKGTQTELFLQVANWQLDKYCLITRS